MNKAAVLMQYEEDDRVDHVPPPTSNMEDRLAVDVSVEDDTDPRDVQPSSAMDVRSSLRGNVSVIPKKCRFYRLRRSTNAYIVFPNAPRGLNTIWEHCETLLRLATAQT